MATLSAIVIAKNEERNIAGCLESLSFADEIIVVDSGSEDNTKKIAERFTEKIYVTEWKGYGGTKQYALERVGGDWVLWVDADERVPAELAQEILNVVAENSLSGYRMPRKAFFLGRWIRYGGWYPGYVIRLFQREKGRFGEERVHERLIVDGPIGKLNEPLLHYTDDSIHHYFDKFNAYTTLAAQDLVDKSKRASLLDLLFRPIHMFLRMYVLRVGYLDGREGFLLAVFSAHYVFTKYAKLWELKRRRRIS